MTSSRSLYHMSDGSHLLAKAIQNKNSFLVRSLIYSSNICPTKSYNGFIPIMDLVRNKMACILHDYYNMNTNPNTNLQDQESLNPTRHIPLDIYDEETEENILTMCAIHNNNCIMEKIIEDNIEVNPDIVNYASTDGVQLIFYYVKHKNIDAIKFLIKHNVDVDIYNPSGLGLATLALINHSKNDIFFLLAKHNPEILKQKNNDGSYLIERCVKNDLVFHFLYIMETIPITQNMLYDSDNYNYNDEQEHVRLIELTMDNDTQNTTIFANYLLKHEAALKIQRFCKKNRI